ncbi:MAG TPA: preprotein translocase subunit YajC [Stellaceae bacterium]|nr:preprotein translocase subunit YajC [Stellaceae bacterium]
MFISSAYAQALGDNANSLIQFAPFVLIFVVFYFFVIRPQQQKTKEHRTMLGALRRGDRVVTGGGIIGTVAKVVGEDEVLVDIAEGIRVRVLRSTITTVLAKTAPVAAKGDDVQSDDGEAEKGKGSARRAAGGK